MVNVKPISQRNMLMQWGNNRINILITTTQVGETHQIDLGVVKDSPINQGLPINIKLNLAIKGARRLIWRVL
ncbi:MutL [Sesbania bispinosa]|nr:MutL [Sesbania bispinosa]